ncbi:MAG: tellurite resistance protein TerC [Marivirga sp.]|jgi:tellurite resistance protein TerC
MIFGLNLQNNPQTSLFILFGVVITIFLIFDLGFFNKAAQKVSLKSATFQSIFWVVISVIFGLLIYKYDGGTIVALEFYSAYITEYALSVDNIFVILLILRYFKVEEKFYHKILFWGVMGAIVFRAIFIFLGAYLIGQFHWILYIFGAFLVYSGVKIFFQEEDDDIDPEQNVIIKFARKYLRITKGHFNGQFIIRRGSKILFTPLFLVILLIESTDLIFAVDSIPAVFAISQSEFILYTSNIFAILGLRAKFFLLAGIIDKFHLLQKGLSFILIFIGGKMLLEFFDIQISTVVSFTVIFAILLLSILMSLLIPKREETSLTNLES